MKLISMRDYVLEQARIGIESHSLYIQLSNRANRFDKICNYARFLNQPLKLWMFAPCNKEGVFLEEPAMFQLLGETEEVLRTSEYKEYRLAKLSVLFEGWEVKKYPHRDETYLKDKNSGRIIDLTLGLSVESQTECFDKFKLVLSESAIRKLGL